VDELTFRQLKESKYRHPQITDVIADPKMMLEMVVDSISITEKGYDTVIDPLVYSFILKYFKEGIDMIDRKIEENGIKARMIVDVNKENIDFINTIKFHEIKHIDEIKGNFGIFDERAYMVFIFHKESEQPDQTLWSNSKALVDRQQDLFNKMWDIAIPLSTRTKELEYQSIPDYQNSLTNAKEIKKQIDLLIQQSRNELLLISSSKLLNLIILTTDFLSQISVLLKRGVRIRILSNNVDRDIKSKFNFINGLGLDQQIEYEFSHLLNKYSEFTVISDGKSMLRCSIKPSNQMMGYFTTEESIIFVQEIVFEKYWNEVMSLKVATSD
jgi:sugar-specific transcriptional regulator TrmB